MQNHSEVPPAENPGRTSAEVSSAKVEMRRIAQQILKEHSAAQRGFAVAILHGFRAGALLLSAKSKVPPKQWLLWLEESFGAGTSTVSIRMLQRYMRLALKLSEFPEFPLHTDNEQATRVSQVERLRELGIESIRSALRWNPQQKDSDVIDSVDVEFTQKPQPDVLPALLSNDGNDPKAEIDIERCVRLYCFRPPILPLSDDYLTPPCLIEAVMEFFEWQLDLDPCANSDPSYLLPAKKSITAAEDGLSESTTWHGNVYVHPPQSSLISWVEKGLAQWSAGYSHEVVFLLPAVTDGDFLRLLQPYPRAFLRERVDWPTPLGSRVNGDIPYLLVFLGEECRYEAFARSLKSVADLYVPHRPL